MGQEQCSDIISKLLKIMFLGAYVSYFIVGTNYLITDFQAADNCNHSYVWEYVLFSLVIDLICFSILFIKDWSFDIDHLSQLGCLGLINLILITWGVVELSQEKCMNGTLLKSFSGFVVIVQIIEFFIYLTVGCFLDWSQFSNYNNFHEDV